ncbi:hypothetical protein G7Y89_g230 [Cudoniella acicularis]|uniref:Uncharacterized protein n=1 Tax=Cudoniella acicularis TaxID=354080 RepID=A0A8H4RXJ2_9HELO|nr:hypothetical protein G7Y89_g230 [Cudoniella acicularis]
MATTLRATTPPPPSIIRTPTTPRLGTFDDDYQPYPSRKSSRISERSERSRASNTTPPSTPGRKVRATPSSPRSSKRTSSSTLTDSLPTSPQTASKKRVPKSSPEFGGQRVSGALNFDSTASAAAALGLSTPSRMDKKDIPRSVAAVRGNGMLPTPAKTPKKRPDEAAPEVKAIARNLFSVRSATVDEAMPSPKKKGKKKYSGFTLNSFEAEDDEQPIQIFTDSHDRVPEADPHPENPFFGDSEATPEPTKRTSKRRKVTVPGEGEQDYEDVERRTDGLIYVFRGKRIFKKFAQTDEAGPSDPARARIVNEMDDDLDNELDEALPSRLRGRITRSSVKPRLLFPTAQQLGKKELSQKEVEDEEADTDIEDPSMKASPSVDIRMHNASPHLATTPKDMVDEKVTTPQAPKFAPASPPGTHRATRSKKVDMGSSPAGPSSSEDDTQKSPVHASRGRGGKISPFDAWQRVKTEETKATNKREGSPVARARGGKRARI